MKPRSYARMMLIALGLAMAHWLCRIVLGQFRGEKLLEADAMQDSCVMFAMFATMLVLHRFSVVRANAVAQINSEHQRNTND